MKPFEFATVSRIVFGRGQFERLGELVAEWGRSALIVTHPARGGANGLLERACRLLDAKGVRHAVFTIDREPIVEDADAGAAAALAAQADVIVALGGGSALDAGKAIAALAANGGGALDYMEIVGRGQKLLKPGLPIIAVPVTAGTGAEVTRNAVIGCPEKQYKASIRGEALLPRIALVDPEIQTGVRPEVTARTGMDALTQCIEAFTSRNGGPLTDALALDGVRHATRGLLRAYHNGADVEAREALALAALISGISLANAGLGAVHGLAAPLGARYPVPHGTVCAALLAPVIEANIAAVAQARPETLDKYAAIGSVLLETAGSPVFTGAGPHSREACLRAAAAAPRAYAAALGIPGLGRFGLNPADYAAITALAQRASSMKHNPVPLSDEVLVAILAQAR